MKSLKKYWDRALVLNKKFQEQVKNHEAFNEDHIPKSLLLTVKEDDFDYEVLQELGKKLKKRMRATVREMEKVSSPFGLTMPDIDGLEIPIVTRSGFSYQKNCDSIQDHNSAMALLELQKKQCNEQIQALKNPSGMKLGLCIFSFVTISCIIAPLVASPFISDSYQCFIIAKAVFLGLFGIGLILILGYLVYLLKWN